MRYVIYGAGAVGGTIGGRLFEHGHEVVLIARGRHYEVLREGGLQLRDTRGTLRLGVPVVPHPAEVDWRAGDVVILSMKTQDTAPAVRSLVAAWDTPRAVLCAQNGVENERLAARSFAEVYGVCVMLPAAHLEPGVVGAYGAPNAGILDLGRYPHGTGDLAETVAADLEASGFSSRPDPAIMRWKYGKLLLNLGNALEAACGRGARIGELYERARSEALECFEAAGIDFVSPEEDRARRDGVMKIEVLEDEPRGGGSTWQSLARRTGTVETDYLNGEIVLLGRRHGIPTPVNELLQSVGSRMARERLAPGSLSPETLLGELGG